MWTRAQLKANGKQLFKKNYWECVAVSFLMELFAGTSAFSSAGNQGENIQGLFTNGDTQSYAAAAVSATVIFLISMIGFALKMCVGTVFEVGGDGFYIQNRTEKPGVGKILSMFTSGHYVNVLVIMLLRELYVILWSFLLIVPGIIKSYEYMMVPYIVAENPGMDRKEAFAISKKMMDGQKWQAFVLDLSFIGWYLLGGLTCGILLVFYVMPYVHATHTELYEYNKIKAYNEGYIR